MPFDRPVAKTFAASLCLLIRAGDAKTFFLYFRAYLYVETLFMGRLNLEPHLESPL